MESRSPQFSHLQETRMILEMATVLQILIHICVVLSKLGTKNKSHFIMNKQTEENNHKIAEN